MSSDDRPILILTNGKKQTEFLQAKLKEKNESVTLLIPPREYLSIPCLKDFLAHALFDRKEAIFLLKILFWQESSQEKLLNELKYYGKEREWIELLRGEEADQKNEISRNISHFIITEVQSYLSYQNLIPRNQSYHVYVRDIPLLEDIFRRNYTEKISIQELEKTMNELGDVNEHEIFALAHMQHIYESVIIRPHGENPFPPGNHGETYFFTQKELWHRGNESLILSTHILSRYIEKLQQKSTTLDHIEYKKMEFCRKSIRTLQRAHLYQDKNLSIIIEIQGEETKISFIPREIQREIKNFLKQLP